MNHLFWHVLARAMILMSLLGALLIPDSADAAELAESRSARAGRLPVCREAPFVPRTHLPGTLVRDREGTYWMITSWPERAEVPESFLSVLHPERAIPMSVEEEACLEERERPWSPLERVGHGTLLEGSLVRTERAFYYVHDGRFYPFASEALARATGYQPEGALQTTEASLFRQGERGFELNRGVFLICPLGVRWP